MQGPTPVYYVVEVLTNGDSLQIKQFDQFRSATDFAYAESARTGTSIEVQDDVGHVLDAFMVRRDR